MHSAGNTAGAGNIMLADGSVQQPTSAGMRALVQNSSDINNPNPGSPPPTTVYINIQFP